MAIISLVFYDGFERTSFLKGIVISQDVPTKNVNPINNLVK